MAGKIIADTIESAGSQITLNVGNVTILTASSTGLTLIPTNNVNINVANSNVTFTTANVTGVATFSAGSNTAPSITTAGDTNTGLYFPAADTIGFVEGGVEAMRIDSSGNLGIGTTSLAFTSGTGLEVERAGVATLRVDNSTSTAAGEFRADATGTAIDCRGLEIFRVLTGGSERARIDSSGNLLLGGTSPVTTNERFFIDQPTSAYWGQSFKLGNSANGIIFTNTSGTASYTAVSFRNNGATLSSCGSITVSGTATAYATSSDYRLKENIAPLTGALAKVAQLNPVTYNWKSTGDLSEGFIAHELQSVVPDCVVGEKDAVDTDGNPVYQGIDTSFLVATLTAAIQELKVIVDAQAVEIAALKAK